jgi:hypothetical protein
MTAHRAHLACKIVDLAAEVIKEVLRARAGLQPKISGLRTVGRPIVRARKLMDR